LNGQTFLLRQNLALALTSTNDARFGRRLDPPALREGPNIGAGEARVDFLVRLFLQGDVPAAARERIVQYASSNAGTRPVYWTAEDAANHRVRTLSHLVLCLPEFQLM